MPNVSEKIGLKQGGIEHPGKMALGAGVFALSTALLSIAGPIGGAIGSVGGGALGAAVADGKVEKGIILGFGIMNGIAFLFQAATGREISA